MRGVRRMPVLIGALLVAAGAIGCTRAGSAAGGTEGGGGGRVAFDQKGVAPATLAPDEGRPAPLQARSAATLPRLGASIIKTAQIEVSVPRADLGESVHDAVEVARRYGGFVASTSVDSEETRRGTVVLRVPSTDFEQALTDLRRLGRTRHENVSGIDVTQEFIDLQARLRNWQAQEAVLLRLMDRAQSVTDTIRVQGELSRVQLEIERLRGRLDYLEDQTDLGTITATFVGAGPSPARPTTLARAWREAVEGSLEVVSAVIVGAGYLVPVAIFGAVAAYAMRALRPRPTQQG